MTDLDLEALREVVDAGTDLPWDTLNQGDVWGIDFHDGDPVTLWNRGPDAALIVAAVNALPVLLDIAEQARGLRTADEWREAFAQAEIQRLAALAEVERTVDGWRKTNAACIAALNRAEKAEAEVARLTAVVQGGLAEAWKQGCLAVCNGGIDECGMSEGHMHPEQNPYLAGGTDTPKGEG